MVSISKTLIDCKHAVIGNVSLHGGLSYRFIQTTKQP